MPLREGKGKLWFKTKEQQDQFDDKMIASVNVQSDDYESDHFTPIFTRQRKEFFLTLSDKAKQDYQKYYSKQSLTSFLDRYYIGKRDHTFNRQWTVQKFYVGYGVSYLLLRDLPIRNFYARCFIMLFFLDKVFQTSGWVLAKPVTTVPDRWTNKDIKNYQAYKDHVEKKIPNLENRLPEKRVWELAQPGYMRYTPERYVGTAMSSVFLERRPIAWDGTWNMPLQALASSRHKDSKWVDFIHQ